ncbi:site-specific integrase [Phyllobacterium sp. 21LDTY02-6]|uniref:site-specific integrase n=1 Tax=Phyllobacterium sp. 21LDTY02-6 TaxID=2944903 RepID=UPI002021ACFB|nr:site-specific integrase [Phyllobacterium sp. 21LDTY02-6]MCO4316299.1 site-specific integrase [Phyllobacterium sp. 21LDTY02-6]
MNDLAAVELPYIEYNPNRHGKARYYFRLNGKRLGRLPDNPDSEEFTKEYWRIRNGIALPEDVVSDDKVVPQIARPGTFHYLCTAYFKSDAFSSLDPTTQSKRRSIIDAMLLEPISETDKRIFAAMPISALDADNIAVLRDRKKQTPFAADERLKVLRQIFEAGIKTKPAPLVKVNTAKLVQSFRQKTDGHATARDEEIRQYIQHHGTSSKAVLALSILMYTGVRVSDLAKLGPQHRRGDSFEFRVFKNRNRHPVTLTILIHPILEAVLAMHPVKGMAYLLTEFGKPFSVKGLGNRVSDWFTQAGFPHLTAHSVRKGLATNMAENEATDHMLEGMFGWSDGKTSKIYTRNARRSKLARQAVLRIDWGEIGNELPHPDEAMASQTATPEKNQSKIR